MKSLFNFAIAAVLFLSILSAGCGTTPQSNTASDAAPKIKVADAVHGDQDVPVDPKRIVSFDYGTLDTLVALGLQNKIAGLPKSNLPELLKELNDEKYANVGTLFEPNFETLYTLKPDLIVVSGRAAAKIPELRKIAPTIFLEPKNEDYYNSFKANTELLGKILNKEAEVKTKLDALDKKVADLKAKTSASEKTGLISLYTAGKISVYGPQSRFGILHQAFGIKPADTEIKEAAQHGQVVNFEYLKKVDPDYLFVIDRAQILGEETLAKTFLDNDVMRSTKAFKNDGVVYLNTENWYTVSGGLRSLDKMVDEIIGIFKP